MLDNLLTQSSNPFKRKHVLLWSRVIVSWIRFLCLGETWALLEALSSLVVSMHLSTHRLSGPNYTSHDNLRVGAQQYIMSRSGSSAILLLFLFLPAVFSANSFPFIRAGAGLARRQTLPPSSSTRAVFPRPPHPSFWRSPNWHASATFRQNWREQKANAFYVVSRLNRRWV